MEINTLNHPQDPIGTPQNPSFDSNLPNQKRFFLILIGVIFLIIVVVGVVYFLRTQKDKQSTPSTTQNSTTPATVTDNYKDWSVNETNGYQIKIPPDWTIYISSKKKEPLQTFSELVKQRNKNKQIIFQREITIGNRKAIIQDEAYTGGHGLAGIVEIDKDYVFLVVGNKQGYFEGTEDIEGLPEPTQKYTGLDYQEFEQILKTLQVKDLLAIESEDKWKTYIDQNKTFSIKYPSIFNETKSNKSSGALTTVQPSNEVTGFKDIVIYFDIIPKKPTESLKQFVNRIANERKGELDRTLINTDSEIKKAIIIDSKNSLWYEGSLGYIGVSHDEIFIPKDESTVVQITIHTGEGGTPDPYKKEHLATIESMLSTFTFIK